MQLRSVIKTSFLCMLFIFSFSLPASEKVLLNVYSVSESTNKQYTLTQLLQLPQHDIDTKLPWTSENNIYTGPYLADVLQAAQVKGQWLRFDALDYYNVSLNYQSIKKFNPILALKQDGKLLTIRTKGPIWLILPVNQHTELNAAIYNDYMIWHLVKIAVQVKESL